MKVAFKFFVGRKIAIFLITLLVLFAFNCRRQPPENIFSQSQTRIQIRGQIYGKVLNQTGQPIENVSLTLEVVKCKCKYCLDPKKCDCCPPRRTVETGVSGSFEFSVPPGTYNLTAKLGNIAVSRQIIIEPRMNEEINIQLEV